MLPEGAHQVRLRSGFGSIEDVNIQAALFS
jgi:hypothetical protein